MAVVGDKALTAPRNAGVGVVDIEIIRRGAANRTQNVRLFRGDVVTSGRRAAALVDRLGKVLAAVVVVEIAVAVSDAKRVRL